MRKWVASKAGFPLLVVLLLSLPLGLAAHSYARIVRLSFVEGDVQVALPGRAQPTRGLLHLPLEHGAAVETPDGVAVVEFEDEALARLAPGSHLLLEELILLDNGERVTQLFLERGTGTFKVRLRRGDSFEVVTPYFRLTVPRKARFRVDVGDEGGRVRVFKGRVRVAEGGNQVAVSKGQMFELDAGRGEYSLARDGELDSWDEWNDYRDGVRAGRVRYRPYYTGTAVYYSHSHWAHYADPYYFCSYFYPYYGGSRYYAGSHHYGYWSVFFGHHSGRHARRRRRHRGGSRVLSRSPRRPNRPGPSGPRQGDEEERGPGHRASDRHREGAPPFRGRGRPALPPDVLERFAPEQPERLLRKQRERFGVSRRMRRTAPARRGAGGREAVRRRAPQASRRAVQARPSRTARREATRQREHRLSDRRPAASRPSARRPSAHPSRHVTPRRTHARRSPVVRSRAPRMQSRTVRRAPRPAASRSRSPSHRKHN